jgi:hypothetical protein
MPTQVLSTRSLGTKSLSFARKFGLNPTSIVFQFEINLNLIGPNKFYLVAYLWAYKGKKAYSMKTDLPVVKGKNVSLNLPADRVTLGNLTMPWKRLQNLAKKNPVLTFTPRLYHNPHVAYDVNGFNLNPSPPAEP